MPERNEMCVAGGTMQAMAATASRRTRVTEGAGRHFFSTFQNMVGPADMKPVTFLRAAEIRRHSPRWT